MSDAPGNDIANMSFAAKDAALASALAQVSELKRELARQTSAHAEDRERLHSLLMAVPVPISVLLGPEHRLHLQNHAHRELFSGLDVIGRPFREVLPHAVDEVLPILDSVYRTGLSVQRLRQVDFWHPPGADASAKRHYDLFWHALRGKDGAVEGVITAKIDVTAHVIAETALQSAIAELTRERELREQFVVTLTHDLRSPLSAATMGTYLIQKKAGEPEELLKLAARVSGSLRRIDQMIRDLLDANSIRAGGSLPITVEPCELTALCQDVVEDLASVHGDRFRLDARGEFHGRWSANGLRRIVENLCANAIKYGHASAPVTITISDHPDGVALEVHNEGEPIAEVDQAVLFEPFRRLTSAVQAGQKGWGVGLTLVRGIAEAHGGRTELESGAAAGTRFRVIVPLSNSKADA